MTTAQTGGDGTAPGRAGRIRQRLLETFAPMSVEVEDESFRHAGHAGSQPGGETHFNIVMVSGAFEGIGRVARSRAVHEALTDEFQNGLHALSMKLRAPGEISS